MVRNMVDLFEILTKVTLAITAVSFVVALFLDLRESRKDKNNDTADD